MSGRYIAAMSTKLILVLGAVALLAYTGVSYGLRHRFSRIEVGAGTGLKGRISAVFHVQSSYSFFLNGKTTSRYDFGTFTSASGQKLRRPDGGSLNEYLHIGDSISKRPHSVEIAVRRGKHLSRWVCPPAAAAR